MGGSYSPPPSITHPENTHRCALWPRHCTQTHTHRAAHVRSGLSSLSCTCTCTHTQARVYILQFIFFSHTRIRVHAHTLCNLYRSQRMEVRHPPQRKLRVSACSAQPNHKSCQATLVSADTHTHTHTQRQAPSFTPAHSHTDTQQRVAVISPREM